jgi:hypothetical protein
MDVRIGTLTSRVTVTDGAGPAANAELIETIVAAVLQRLHAEHTSRETQQREGEVRQQMSERPRY